MAGNAVSFKKEDLVTMYASFMNYKIEQEERIVRMNTHITTLREAGKQGMAGGKGDKILESAEQISQVIAKIVVAIEAATKLLQEKMAGMQLLEEGNGKVAQLNSQTSDMLNKANRGMLQK